MHIEYETIKTERKIEQAKCEIDQRNHFRRLCVRLESSKSVFSVLCVFFSLVHSLFFRVLVYLYGFCCCKQGKAVVVVIVLYGFMAFGFYFYKFMYRKFVVHHTCLCVSLIL